MMNEVQRQMFSVNSAGGPAVRAERRREPRTRLARPVYVCPAIPSDGDFEEVRTMRDFSRGGFYFTTERASYAPGMQLFTTPATGCFNLEYLCVVLRVEPLPVGEYGVAVRLVRLAGSRVKAESPALFTFRSFLNGVP
jgi:PilZ domain